MKELSNGVNPVIVKLAFVKAEMHKLLIWAENASNSDELKSDYKCMEEVINTFSEENSAQEKELDRVLSETLGRGKYLQTISGNIWMTANFTSSEVGGFAVNKGWYSNYDNKKKVNEIAPIIKSQIVNNNLDLPHVSKVKKLLDDSVSHPELLNDVIVTSSYIENTVYVQEGSHRSIAISIKHNFDNPSTILPYLFYIGKKKF